MQQNSSKSNIDLVIRTIIFHHGVVVDTLTICIT